MEEYHRDSYGRLRNFEELRDYTNRIASLVFHLLIKNRQGLSGEDFEVGVSLLLDLLASSAPEPGIYQTYRIDNNINFDDFMKGGKMSELILTDLTQLNKVLCKFSSQPSKPIFFDTEFTSLDFYAAKLVAVQMYQPGLPPIIFDARDKSERLVGVALGDLIVHNLLLVGHNLSAEYGILLTRLGIRVTRLFDTMIAEQVIHGVGFTGAARKKIELGLGDTAERYGIHIKKEKQKWFADLDKRPEWSQPFPEEVVKYMKQDVTTLEPVFEGQLRELRDRGLLPAMKLEMEALPAFGEMEHNGILIDAPKLEEFIAEKAVEAEAAGEEVKEVFRPAILFARAERYDKELEAWEKWCSERDAYQAELKAGYEDKTGWGKYKVEKMKEWREANPAPKHPKPIDDKDVNIGSPAQLADAFRVMNIPATKTDDDTLKELQDTYPVISQLRTYREKEKFVENFGPKLLEKRNPITGRIHPSIFQIGADTGRTSITNPNTQQLPSKGEDGKRFRSFIIAAPGNVLISNDYPNIELRILAYISKCQGMLSAFERGENIHAATAYAISGLDHSVDIKSTIARDKSGNVLNGASWYANGKTTNFLLAYAGSKWTLARNLNTTVENAETILNNFFTTFPEIRTYQEHIKAETLKTLTTHNLSGRAHYYNRPIEPTWTGDRTSYRALMKEYRKQVGTIERAACNYPIQGTSADITKKALALLYSKINPEVIKIVLVVHDEIVIECEEELAQEASRILEECMTESCAFYMPDFPIDCSGAVVGPHWKKG